MKAALRQSVRRLVRNWEFTAAVVGILAIGMASSTVMSVVWREALSPHLPFANEERVVLIDELNRAQGTPVFEFASRYLQVRARSSSFECLAAQMAEQMNLVVREEPEALMAAWVSPDFFAAFGSSPFLGRTFYPEEFVSGKDAGSVVILSYETWKRRFGGDRAILSREVELGGRHRRVVGVMPQRFVAPPRFASWGVFLPLREEDLRAAGSWGRVWMVGRLKKGTSVAAAAAELKVLGVPDLKLAEMWEKMQPSVDSVRDRYRPGAPQLFWAFGAAVAILYAAAVFNATNLLLMQMSSRGREIAVRVALGASRWRVATWLICECAIVCALSGALGGVLAWETLDWFGDLAASALPGERPPLSSNAVEMWLIAAAIAFVTGLILASVSAWRGGRPDIYGALKAHAGLAGESRRQKRLRGALVCLQSAVAVALMIAAGICAQSYLALCHVGFGFDGSGVLFADGAFATGAMPLDGYLQLSEAVKTELLRVPGTTSVALVENLPISSWVAGCQVKSAPATDESRFECSCNRVSPSYFEMLGLRIGAGRVFGEGRPGDAVVAVINETLAGRLFGKRSPIGQRIDLGEAGQAEIVGVIGDTREKGPRLDALPQVYLPFWARDRNATSWLTVLVRTRDGFGRPGLESAIRQACRRVAPNWTFRLRALTEEGADLVRVERTTSLLIGCFGALALLVASLGVFSVAAYSVVQRQRELALRSALGATAGRIYRQVVIEGLALTAGGVVLGTAGAMALGRFLGSVLFEISALDPNTYATMPLVFLALTVVACSLPAWRAARIAPAAILRDE